MFKPLSKFVLAVQNGRMKDHLSVFNLSRMNKPVLSISNLTNFDKLHRSYATLDNVPKKARYDAVLAETMTTFFVFALIDSSFIHPDDQYYFLIHLPTNLKPKLENELSKIHKLIFPVKHREDHISQENPQLKYH